MEMDSSGLWFDSIVKAIHRCKCGISPLQRQQLASLSMFAYRHAVLVRALLAKAMGLPFAGVLHQGLPGRHRPVLSLEVRGQST